METFDGEVLDKTLDWLDRDGKGDKPFFCWFNTTAIHIWSHPPKKYIQMAVDEGRAEEDVVRAKMLEHDEQVGTLLKKLEDLGVDDNTIVIYTHRQRQRTDDVARRRLRAVPRREGHHLGRRRARAVPDQVARQDPGRAASPTACRATRTCSSRWPRRPGCPTSRSKLLKGYKMNGTTYKVHLDGYNNLDHWTGKTRRSRRAASIFYYDETDLMAMRVDDWKMHIGVKPTGSWLNAKAYPSVPYLFNLLMDPMEKMDPESHEWGYIGRKFFAAKLWAPTAAGPFIAAHLKSLMEFPPRRAPTR